MSRSGPHNNTSSRSVLNTRDPTKISIEYRAKMADRYERWLLCLGIMNPFSGLLCNYKRVWQSTYVQVHENRIETNYPHSKMMCCCCCVTDNVDVIYFDRTILKEVTRAGACKPACTHCSCCPTCCDSCGEGIVIYNPKARCCCWQLITGVSNADELKEMIRKAKQGPISKEIPEV
jgi:hypothetical protein